MIFLISYTYCKVPGSLCQIEFSNFVLCCWYVIEKVAGNRREKIQQLLGVTMTRG